MILQVLRTNVLHCDDNNYDNELIMNYNSSEHIRQRAMDSAAFCVGLGLPRESLSDHVSSNW